MASRVLKLLSPPKKNISSIRRSPSTKTPLKNKFSRKNKQKKDTFLSPFKVDTPNRRRLVESGLQNRHPIVLGIGGFGKVYKASYKGEQVAVKIIDGKKHKNLTLNAEKHAASLIHDNIVKVFAIEEGDNLSLITMELCRTSLQERLEESPLTRKERIFIWKGVSSALRFCHNSGIVHADVKPKNILMGVDGEPKLADFGSSLLINEPCLQLTLHGTPGYVAPEVVRGKVPTPSSDIFSLGVVAWQMLARKPPFQGLHGHTILYLTAQGARPKSENLDDGFHGKYKELYTEMWAESERCRPALIVVITELNKLMN